MVLIANRGDIAVGVIRTCESLGPETVVAVSEAGKDSMAATLADRAVCISPPRPLNSYLNVGAIVTAALGRKSDAIHSVYGFLLKQPRLAQACSEYDAIFIGPPAEVIAQVGNKILARQITERLGMPVVPGSERVANVQGAMEISRAIGFSLLLKAAAGKARAALGDDTLYKVSYYMRQMSEQRLAGSTRTLDREPARNVAQGVALAGMSSR
ncbi:MAG: hypothetical protein KIT07_00715 [Anaerolineales bacterium]|nr:hypothetical protein [Accumulibacter sp.]MCW5886627.1 hypothetical protein [Anaerolineales bacterium]